jgi:uncharacterized membrane protein YfcA
MSPFFFTLTFFVVAIVAGFIGSILGLGGGVIIVPALTLLYGIDVRYAIGASIISVIATSCGASVYYLKERMTNLRLAMLLSLATTSGAISGAYLAGIIDSRRLLATFGFVMAVSALAMLRPRKEHRGTEKPDKWADALQLHGNYHDEVLGKDVPYPVAHVKLGLFLMYLAGVISGLLGIGSGALKVPALDLAMRLPIKASSATSNFMIGITAAASAGVYFARGDVDPFIAGPAAAGVVLGAALGSKILGKIDSRVLRLTFVSVLLLISAQMAWKGLK